ncbi:hypothetical protein C8R45DRAFT_1030066 [Mycena sanguinolenta]|nr:hypothetical protein C8R45DRAFT_1030066 [Mycena sanguinolenta]
MRVLSALPLDDDLVDRIFTFCPAFDTLHSLMLVSKASHRVYQTHPKSITWAVAYNVVGPVLPQALSGGREEADPAVLAMESPEDDRTSVIIPGEKKSEDSIRHVQQQRTAVLQEYSTDELLQLYAVVRFFRGILEDPCVGYPNQLGIVNVLSTLGPDGVKRVWEERAYDSLADEIAKKKVDWDEDLDYPLFTGYFSLPLGNIWTVRNVKSPNDEEPASKFILDIIIGGNDTCSQCATLGGLSLLTEANWHRAPLYPSHLLKGKLMQTTTFQKSLFDALYTHARHNRNSSHSDSHDYLRDNDFGPQEHVWRWLLQELIEGGWLPPPDCWYGYDCRTMVHDHAHANKLNHLCVPTHALDVRISAGHAQ